MSCPTSRLNKPLPPLPLDLNKPLPPLPPDLNKPLPPLPLDLNKPLPPLPARDPRRLSQASTLYNFTQHGDSPRPDSSTFSQNNGLSNIHLLDPNNLHVLAQEDFYHVELYATQDSSPPQVQYWLRAEDVLVGLPGKDRVPPGHWPKLLQLAQETDIGQRSGPESGRNGPDVQEVRLLTVSYTLGQEEDTKMDAVDTRK